MAFQRRCQSWDLKNEQKLGKLLISRVVQRKKVYKKVQKWVTPSSFQGNFLTVQNSFRIECKGDMARENEKGFQVPN